MDWEETEAPRLLAHFSLIVEDSNVIISHDPCGGPSGTVKDVLDCFEWVQNHECDRGIK